MSAHSIPQTPPPLSPSPQIHQFFKTDEFQAFLKDPYKNVHVDNMRSVLSFFTDPNSLSSIESDIRHVFKQEHVPAQRLFQYEIDRIKYPDRSLPGLKL